MIVPVFRITRPARVGQRQVDAQRAQKGALPAMFEPVMMSTVPSAVGDLLRHLHAVRQGWPSCSPRKGAPVSPSVAKL